MPARPPGPSARAEGAAQPQARPAARPLPPEAERALGLRAYLTDAPGIGGRLREVPEDFVVVELGPGPRQRPGPYAAARVRLRNWETNRFAQRAAREAGVRVQDVAFAGMKDKRAVTEQWFTFRCAPERLAALAGLQDVEVLSVHASDERAFAGSHAGNRFVLRVRGARADRDAVARVVAQVRAEAGVPNFFGPQRFGAAFRPVTHLVGRAIVAGDLEEAVRLYLGNPMPTESPEASRGRRVYEETRDPAAALAVYPGTLEPERAMLERLVRRPGDWRHCLQALPQNLLQLFVHAWQSYLYNLVLSARLEAGLGLRAAQPGDRVLPLGDDGTRTVLVTAWNRPRVQREIDAGRAAVTAPLVGTATPLAEDAPGEAERAVLAGHGVEPAAFRCRELPEVASEGRRRAVLEPVRDLEVAWEGDDPVFSFALGRGAYATVVLREVMKAGLDAY